MTKMCVRDSERGVQRCWWSRVRQDITASEWKEKTAESERTKRIWPRENPISEKVERNKGYLAINSHLKEPKIHAGDERTTWDNLR